MSNEALSLLPVTFKSLVVENTTHCNAKCSMCYQSVGPKGLDQWGRAALNPEEVERVIREAISIKSLGRRFHIAGGESFLKIDEVIHLIKVAREVGFTNISTTTNAFWAKKTERADEICRRIKTAGLTSMEVSWDYWHQPYINAQAIDNCILACARFNIQLNLRVLTTRSHSAEEALRHLNSRSLDLTGEISSCPVFPTGRAKNEIPAEDIFSSGDLSGSCHHMLNLTVNALGNVAPCCAGADQTDGLSFGNIRKQSIAEIAERMQASPLLRVLVFQGVSSFLPILQQHAISPVGDHANICHLCFEIFNDAKRSAAVHGYFDDKLREAVVRSIRKYQKKLEINMQTETST
jgi:organic radical activating enzyme